MLILSRREELVAPLEDFRRLPLKRRLAYAVTATAGLALPDCMNRGA
jgi:hypothetical protein